MAKLNEGIAKIVEGSVLDTYFKKLVTGFTLASKETLPDFSGPGYVTVSPDGQNFTADTDKINKEIAEYQSVVLQNSAYLLAEAAISSLGYSPDGKVDGALMLSGGSLTGHLNALYGFTAGANGTPIFEVEQKTDSAGHKKNVASVYGELHLDSDGLYLNGVNVLKTSGNKAIIDSENIQLDGNVTATGTITVGNFVISKDGMKLGNYDYYHTGNANLTTVDWKMNNGAVHGKLSVEGASLFNGNVSAVNGAVFGYGGKSVMSFKKDGVAELRGDLNIVNGGVKINDVYVIHDKNEKTVSFSATGKVLNIGDDNTEKISLHAGLYDIDGENELVSVYGAGYFPSSFSASHENGEKLIETYKNSPDDMGVLFRKYIRFSDIAGPAVFGESGKLAFKSGYTRTFATNLSDMILKTTVGYEQSTSLFAPQDRDSASFTFSTDADFYVFDKPLEGKTSIGITGSKTRLSENQLFFNDNVYMRASMFGITYSGNSYFDGDLSSPTFSAGFAGSGWSIRKKKLTGNVHATFDELTVRRKMRLYELEVQKKSATNGSLWITNSCSGDIVEEII